MIFWPTKLIPIHLKFNTEAINTHVHRRYKDNTQSGWQPVCSHENAGSGNYLAVQTHTRGLSKADATNTHTHTKTRKQAPSLKPKTITHINTHTLLELINAQMEAQRSCACVRLCVCVCLLRQQLFNHSDGALLSSCR